MGGNGVNPNDFFICDICPDNLDHATCGRDRSECEAESLAQWADDARAALKEDGIDWRPCESD